MAEVSSDRGSSVHPRAGHQHADGGPALIAPARPREVRTLVLTLLAAVAVGLGAGLAPWPTSALVAAVVLVRMLPRLDRVAVVVVAAAPLAAGLQADAAGVGLRSSTAQALSIVPVVVLLAACILALARGRLPARVLRGVLPPVLVAVGVTLMVLVLVLPDEAADPFALLLTLAQVLVALGLVTALRATVEPTRLVVAYVVVATTISLGAVALQVVRPGQSYAADWLTLTAASALPLVLAVPRRRRRPLRIVVATLLFACVLLEVSVGNVSPAVLLGFVAMAAVAAASGQLGVRSLTGLVALALVAVATMPVLLRGVRAAELRPGALSGAGAVDLVILVVITFTALVSAWPRWRNEHDTAAGGLCAALAGTAVIIAVTGGLATMPLWLLTALAATTGDRRTSKPPADPAW